MLQLIRALCFTSSPVQAFASQMLQELAVLLMPLHQRQSTVTARQNLQASYKVGINKNLTCYSRFGGPKLFQALILKEFQLLTSSIGSFSQKQGMFVKLQESNLKEVQQKGHANNYNKRSWQLVLHAIGLTW